MLETKIEIQREAKWNIHFNMKMRLACEGTIVDVFSGRSPLTSNGVVGRRGEHLILNRQASFCVAFLFLLKQVDESLVPFFPFSPIK